MIWLFIARAPKTHQKCEAGVGTQRPTDECMESMPNMQNMGMGDVHSMHRWGVAVDTQRKATTPAERALCTTSSNAPTCKSHSRAWGRTICDAVWEA